MITSFDTTQTEVVPAWRKRVLKPSGSLRIRTPEMEMAQSGGERTIRGVSDQGVPGPVLGRMKVPERMADVAVSPTQVAPEMKAAMNQSLVGGNVPQRGIDLGNKQYAFASNVMPAQKPYEPYYGPPESSLATARKNQADFQARTRETAKAYGLINPGTNGSVADQIQYNTAKAEQGLAAGGKGAHGRMAAAERMNQPLIAAREAAAERENALARTTEQFVRPAEIQGKTLRDVENRKAQGLEAVEATRGAFGVREAEVAGKSKVAEAEATAKAEASRTAAHDATLERIASITSDGRVDAAKAKNAGWVQRGKIWSNPQTGEIFNLDDVANIEKEISTLRDKKKAGGEYPGPDWMGGWNPGSWVRDSRSTDIANKEQKVAEMRGTFGQVPVETPATPGASTATPAAGTTLRQTTEVRRKTADGRVAVFGADKKFLRYE